MDHSRRKSAGKWLTQVCRRNIR